jgi:catechol 2,3-dioxygenase-like lactoylglutathione lyase family enzyme
MPRSLAHIALVVRDYDEAIAWFTGVLGFTLVADQYQPEQGKHRAISAEGGSEIAPSKRWVLVAPPGGGDNAATLLLVRAWPREQAAAIEKREEATQRHPGLGPGSTSVLPRTLPNPFGCRVWPDMTARC